MSLARLPSLCSVLRICLSPRSQTLKPQQAACLHASSAKLSGDKPRDRRDLTRNMPQRVEGVEGQNAIEIDVSKEQTKCYRLPDENLANELFDGIPYFQTHVCYIKATKNNTLITMTDPECKKMLIKRSCGREGFKHCRKGTTVAAQATGVGMANRMIKAGVRTCRIVVRGLGPGRMEAVKGMLIGGVNIISITDDSPYYDHPSRPPAARSV